MEKKMAKGRLHQVVMLSLVSMFSVLVMATASHAALQCFSCHGQTNDIRPLDTGAALSSYRNITTGAVKGSHQKHVAATTDASKCNVCHNTQQSVPGHRDGRIELATGIKYAVPGITGDVTFKNQTSVPVLGTCTATCHASTSTTVGVATPAWGESATCTSCHASSPVTGSHAKHLTGTSYHQPVCADCHTGYVQDSSAPAGHVDANVFVSAGSYPQPKTKGSPYASCSTTSCHSSGQAEGGVLPPTYSAPTWGGTAACGTCHAVTTLTTGSHTMHLAKYANDCGKCHTNASATAYNSTAHVDGLINVDSAVQGYTATHAPGSGYGQCMTATCHSAFTDVPPNTQPLWGIDNGSIQGNCDACHYGSPGTSGVAGAHSKHPSTCSTCHTAYGTATHADGFTTFIPGMMAAPVQKHVYGVYNATCTTACHNPLSTSATIVTPNWGQTATCTSCHVTTKPTTGAHSIHLTTGRTSIVCASCHTGVVEGSNSGPNHGDQNIDVIATAPVTLTYPQNKTKGSAYGTCSNISCHTGVLKTASPSIVWPVSVTSDCANCHGYPPSSHSSYGNTTSCNGCHTNVKVGVTQTTPIESAFVKPLEHMDGIIPAAGCNSCHGYPPVQSIAALGANAGTSLNYSTAKLQNYSGGGGAHSVAGHLALTTKPSLYTDKFEPCLTCHPSTSHNEGGSVFLTANVQVVVDPKYKFDKNRPIVYNAKQSGTGKISGTCTNVECHFKPSPLWSSQPYTQAH